MNWADLMKYRTDEIIEQMNAIIDCEDKGDRALMMARLLQILERTTQEGEE